MTKTTTVALLAATTLLALLASPAAAQLTPYDVDPDNVEGPWVNLNLVPTRPMLLGTGDGHLYVTNTHDSTIERFVAASGGAPDAVWGVPWAPVAIAEWLNPVTSAHELVVACRGSYGLVRLDRATGVILGVTKLPPGPADVLVDQARDAAYVSCADADAVVEVDLTSDSIVRVYSEATTPGFRMKQPTFLSFLETNGLHDRVLVAPLLSGNNSTPVGDETPNASGSVADLEGTNTELPDEDLFLIDPAPAPGAPFVTVLARDMGTVQFAHGVHPNTGRFWQLNTDHDNKHRLRQSEPAVKGEFANNRVTIIDLPTPGATPVDGADDANSTVAILDPYDIASTNTGGLGGNFDITNTVGQPYAMAFRPGDGHVFICGLLTDNVVVLGQNETYVTEFDLPDGSIPRGLVFDGDDLYVYAWGTNEVFVYDTTPTPTLVRTFSLRHDPTPAHLKVGREVFYDARFSEHRNLSCATCHVEGGTDMLSWNLSEPVLDDKGPMLTQTLKSLEKLTPFHWRGERQLADFEPAFHGLLGDTVGIGPAFEDVSAFILSMNVPANPFQNEERLLDDAISAQLPPGTTGDDPERGQFHYSNTLIAVGANFTCNDCHALPTGTNNDIFPDFPIIERPRRAYFKPAPFHDMPIKQQSRVTVDVKNHIGVRRGYLGGSVAHTGQVPDLFRFIEAITTAQGLIAETGQIASFIHQLDSGLAPAVHGVAHLNSNTMITALPSIGALEQQASLGHCDLVVIGQIDNGSGLVDARWAFDRTTSTYVPDVAALGARTLTDFATNTLLENNTFLGLPVGSGRRFAIDNDLDGILDPVDGSRFTPDPADPNDTTPPSSVGTPRIIFATTKVARLAWETDEPATAILEYREVGSPTWMRRFYDDLALARSVILDGLRPSNDVDYPFGSANPISPVEVVQYEWRVIVLDRSGNRRTLTAPDLIETDSYINFPNPGGFSAAQERVNHGTHIVAATTNAGPGVFNPGLGTYQDSVTVDVAYKRSGNRANDRVVVGRVLVRRAGTENWVHDPVLFPVTAGAGTTTLQTASLIRPGTPPTVTTTLDVDGPFLLSGLTVGGRTTLAFEVGGVTTGDEVLFNVEAVVEIPPQLLTRFAVTPQLWSDINRGFLQWSFADGGEAATRSIAMVP